MTSRIVGFAAVVVAALSLPLVTGCAEEEYDQDVAYPQPIGYTAPSTGPATLSAQVAASDPATAPGAQPEQAPAPYPEGAQPSDVVVGDADGEGFAEGDGAAAAAAGADGQYADTDPSALTDFRSTLDPYGSWVDDPTYGTVWVPSSSVVGSNFTPYVSAGHWDYDDDDYTWVSDYDWGWAPFHYGRWVWTGGYGWEWIPGRDYAGAWVTWRYGWGDWGYVGWAPLGPTWCWRDGYAVGLGFVPAAPYAFVGTGELFSPSVGSRVVAGAQAAAIGAHTRPYVPASPGVGGRVGATPRVGGPPPSMLHIPASAVAHAGTTARGVMQARAFAHPATAMAMGAHAPQAYAASRLGRGFGRATAPAYGAPAPSHFGGKLGSGFRAGPASSFRAYSGSTFSRSPYSMGSRPYAGAASRPYSGGAGRAYSGGGFSRSPGFRSYGSYGGFHGYGGHPVAPSGGSHHSSGYSEGYGGFHRGGGFRGGGFHGGGFGGFHGGGGGGHGGGHR